MVKNLKKMLAVVLALSLAMSLLTVGASAVGELICDKQAHTHSAECYERTLICDLAEEEGHSHSSACYDLVCGQVQSEGHTHSDACYDAEHNLTCGQA